MRSLLDIVPLLFCMSVGKLKKLPYLTVVQSVQFFNFFIKQRDNNSTFYTHHFSVIRGAKKKPYLTVEQFVQFLNKEQRDPRLNEILYPYYTVRQAQDLIDQYESRQNMAAKGAQNDHTYCNYFEPNLGRQSSKKKIINYIIV